MAGIENFFEQIKSLPTGKIMVLILVVVLSITGMFLLFSWTRKADYQVLYSNLSEDDAGRIAQELGDRKVPYELGPAGTVLVPSNKVYELRLQLAAQGLPQGAGVGFEIFDNTSFTTSEFVQKLNFRRALEGELARTIRSLSGVRQARVHLVVPDKSMFAFEEDRTQPSAAVFVSLQQGRRLNNSEVEGIIYLVSSSVEDLSPNNITVVDNRGDLLTKPDDDSMMSQSSTQMEYQHDFEKKMASRIISILEPVVGRGKVKARVSSEFDFTRSERTEEIYDPDGAVVRSEQKSTEKTTSGGPAGVPGVASNMPGGAPGNLPSSMGQSQKQDETINYETSKTVTRIVESPVTLERLSVAILIDGILPSRKDSVENAEKYTLHTEEDVKYYEDIVKKTVGFTDDRGDEISLTVMPFREIETIETGEVKRDYLPVAYTVLRYLSPVAVALLFILFIIRPLIRSLSKMSPRQMSASLAPAEAGTELGQPAKPKEITVEKQVVNWADKNPEQAAGIVKGWLEDR